MIRTVLTAAVTAVATVAVLASVGRAAAVAETALQHIDTRPGLPDQVDPAEDLPGTVRVHPDDDPEDPTARRWVKDDSGYFPWTRVTGYPDIPALREVAETDETEDGYEPVEWLRDLADEEVRGFPRQTLADVARVLGVR